MKICLITGSAGLVGSEAVIFFSDKFDSVIGIDNDMRGNFFGKNASVKSSLKNLKKNNCFQNQNTFMPYYFAKK